jgi:hypothetical protein
MMLQASANQGPPFSVFMNCLYAFGSYPWVGISLFQDHQLHRKSANVHYKTVHTLDRAATVIGSPF